jgi:hypothetical protein
MQVKTPLNSMPLITTMITNHLARWKTMQFKAPIYGVSHITTMITYSHIGLFLSLYPREIDVLFLFMDKAALASTALLSSTLGLSKRVS